MKRSYFTLRILMVPIACILVLSNACTKHEDFVSRPASITPFVLDYPSYIEEPVLLEDIILTEERIALGKALFYDKQLSLDNSVSCSSCHKIEMAFSDTNTLSFGVDNTLGKRQSMPLFNLAWNPEGFFWDGRARLLRHQVLMPIQDPLEMKETLPSIVSKIQNSERYAALYYSAFGHFDVDTTTIASALQQFVLSITSFESKYDRYLQGAVSLSPAEERGRELFYNEYNPGFPDISGADCAHCHTGNLFTNNQFLNNGINAPENIEDIGREEVTGNPDDKGKFRTPSLRNLRFTHPYMHKGQFKTLEEVLEHYDSGIHPDLPTDPALLYAAQNGGLQLSDQDKQDLIAFLRTLDDYSLLTNENLLP